MRTFPEKVKQFVKTIFEKIIKNFIHQEKMPEIRHFSKNKKFYVFSVFANFTRFYDSENGKKLIRLGHFYTARQRFVSILTKIRDCARR